MIKYINSKTYNNIMKKIFMFIILCLFVNPVFSIDLNSNSTSLGGKQVNVDSPLFIDFSSLGNLIMISIFFILLIISFIFIIHYINSFLLLVFSIMMMANGFNLLIAFILMLVSIIFLLISKNNN